MMFFIEKDVVADLMVIKSFFYVCILIGILMPCSFGVPPSFAGNGRDGFLQVQKAFVVI